MHQKMTTQQEIIPLPDNLVSLSHLAEDHLRVITENIYLPHYQICFSPREIDFVKFQAYPQSSHDSKLLSRRTYLLREEYKDDLRHFDALVKAITLFSSQQDIYLVAGNQDPINSFFLPKIFNYGEKSSQTIKVPAGEKIILLGYPSLVNGHYQEVITNAACLFPGKITLTNNGYVYTSYSLDEALTLLDKKTNYSIEAPFLNIDKKETLESLKQKLIAYLRTKIKPSLQDPRSLLYQLNNSEGDLPLEKHLNCILEGNIGPEESLLFREFPLIFSSLTEEVILYINEEKAIIRGDDNDSTGGRLFIMNPVLASEQRTGKYTFPISIELRALHINYAFQLTSQEPTYEDFLGEANWIVAPITIIKSNGLLHGKVEAIPYYFEDSLRGEVNN